MTEGEAERRLFFSLLLLFLILPALMLHGQEFLLRPLVAADARRIEYEDLFYTGELDQRRVEILENGFDSGHETFGDRAAIIPLWQIRRLIHGDSSKERGDNVFALVGSPVVYIPDALSNGAESVQLQITKKILDLLVSRGEHPDTRVELELLRVPKKIEGARIEDVQLLTPLNFPRGGRIRVLVRGRKGNEEIRAVAEAELRYFQGVYLADRVYQRGESLSLEQFSRSARPAEEVSSRAIGPEEGVFLARRRIAAGEQFTTNNIRPKPDVEAGDRLRVLIRSGAIELRIEGTAQASGRRGEEIPTKLQDGSITDCRIIEEGVVSLELQPSYL